MNSPGCGAAPRHELLSVETLELNSLRSAFASDRSPQKLTQWVPIGVEGEVASVRRKTYSFYPANTGETHALLKLWELVYGSHHLNNKGPLVVAVKILKMDGADDTLIESSNCSFNP